jgi:hypothetical protein
VLRALLALGGLRILEVQVTDDDAKPVEGEGSEHVPPP